MEPRVTRWESGPPPKIEELERHLRSEGIPFYSWSNKPGTRYSPHSHSFVKVIYVVEGSIAFTLPEDDSRIDLRPGDRLVLPSATAHEALVGPEGVLCLEGHLSSS